jgi:TRAP-type mannitol/chloroaromatic compound transport system permease small subunit
MGSIMNSAASRLESLIDRIGEAASLLSLVIIGLMACNVLLRYLFSAGSVWAQELEWHLLAALILFAMSYTLQRGDNVRVDIFYAKYSPKTQRLVNIVSVLLTIAIAIVMIILCWRYVGQSFSIGEKSPDPGGIPFRWAIKALLPIGFGLVVLQSLAGLLRLLCTPLASAKESRHA